MTQYNLKLEPWTFDFPHFVFYVVCYCLTQVNCAVFFLCILTWWWFGKSEPVCAQRSSAPCRSVPSQWPLPTPPPPSACRLYLWRDGTHHSGTRQSQKKRAKMSQNLSGLTLWDCFEKLKVRDDPTLLHLWWTIRFLGFTPEVGATVHAGYVEDSDALQRYVAEVQGSPATLAEAKQKRKETFSELKNDSFSFWPQSQDSPSAFCRRQRWSQRWQTQNTKVCSSSWKVRKEMDCFKRQLEERTCPPS